MKKEIQYNYFENENNDVFFEAQACSWQLGPEFEDTAIFAKVVNGKIQLRAEGNHYPKGFVSKQTADEELNEWLVHLQGYYASFNFDYKELNFYKIGDENIELFLI